MKIFTLVVLIIIGYFTYKALTEDYSVDPYVEDELIDDVKKDPVEKPAVIKPVEKIVEQKTPPKIEAPVKPSTPVAMPKNVNTPIEKLSPDEIHTNFQKLWMANVQSGMNYLRSALLNKKVSLSAKEDLLDILYKSQFPKSEFSTFTREILGETDNPYVFKKVLHLHGETISAERKRTLLKELLSKPKNQEIIEVIREYVTNGYQRPL